jgi:hypothetical protein
MQAWTMAGRNDRCPSSRFSRAVDAGDRGCARAASVRRTTVAQWKPWVATACAQDAFVRSQSGASDTRRTLIARSGSVIRLTGNNARHIKFVFKDNLVQSIEKVIGYLNGSSVNGSRIESRMVKGPRRCCISINAPKCEGRSVLVCNVQQFVLVSSTLFRRPAISIPRRRIEPSGRRAALRAAHRRRHDAWPGARARIARGHA